MIVCAGVLTACGGGGSDGGGAENPSLTQPTQYGPQAGDVLFTADMSGLGLPVKLPNGFSWLEPDTDGKNSVQVVLPSGSTENTYLSLPVDISQFRGMQIQFECDLSAADVTPADQVWKGAVCQLAHDTTSNGSKYSSFSNAWGSFAWTTFTSKMTIPSDATNGRIVLGMQGSTGTVKIRNWKIRLIRKAITWPDVDLSWAPSRTSVFRGVNAGNYSATVLSDMAQWKVNVVRWQLNADQATASNLSTYDKWLDSKLIELDSVLADAKLQGIKVSIDMHVTPGGRLENDSNAMFYSGPLQDYFVEAWKKIANRYKGNSSIFAYELINEPVQEGFVPAGLLDWRNLQVKAAKAIRAIDPSTPISISVDNYDGAGNFRWMDPVPVSGVIYSVHMYEPMTYTHQGVYSQYAAAGSLTYPGSLNGLPFNKQSLKNYLQPVRDFQIANKATIWVGEFSAVRWAPGAGQYLTDLTSIFDEWGWDWCYHSYRQWSGWSLEAENLPIPVGNLDAYIPATTNDRMQAIRFWLDQNK